MRYIAIIPTIWTTKLYSGVFQLMPPKDGTVLKDEQSRMVFNQESYCELIKHLLKKYVGISYAEASALVEQSHLAEPVATYMEAALLNHEFPYYWAMSLYYGDMYWLKGIPAQPDNTKAYFRLEDRDHTTYDLKEPFVDE